MISDSSLISKATPLPAPIGLPVALPDEFRPLARRLGLPLAAAGLARGNFAGRPLVALLTGVGHRFARQGAQRLVREEGCRSLLAVGFGGGLVGSLQAGDVGLVTAAVDESGQRWAAAETGQGLAGLARVVCLSTEQALGSPAAKAAANAASGAQVVDMETATVAQVASEENVAWAGLRAVSDPADAVLPGFIAAHLDPMTGQMRLGRLLVWLLPRPGAWPAVARLGRDSRRAGRALAEAVAEFLESLA